MEIVIFKELTTEGVISSIEENSKKYHEGFYADMNNAPERKLVKESAADINTMIKELKASRIKITKANTAAVNKEHDAIVARLEVANKPFTTLIDVYNVERKAVLDAEKARKQAIEDAVKLEADHEYALLINKTFEFDRAEVLRLRTEELAVIKRQATIDAEERAKSKAAHAEQVKINEENSRLANKVHCAKVNNTILACLLDEGFSESEAKKFIRLAAKNKLPQLTINY
ncbi:MAG: hypothetical protein V3R25_06030 [Nitrosomonadaceae bacterium]